MSCIAAAAAAAAAAASASSRLQPVLTTKTLTDLLQSESIWKLKLYKAPSDHFDDFSQFCNALESNQSITSAEVTWRFLRNLSDPQRDQLMEKIGALPKLKEIAMEVAGPTSVLTVALHNASNLKSLKIGKLRFASNQDVVGLAEALRHCKALKQISLSSFQVMVLGNHVMDNEGMVWFMEGQNNMEKIVLDPLLDSIASLPVLEHVRFQHYLNGSKIQLPSEQSMRSLCRSPRKSLIFNSCGLSDEQCFAIADELESNSDLPLSILVVTRNADITSFAWDAFVQMLAVNCNIVDFHHGEEGQINAPSPEQLAKIGYYLRLNLAGRKHLLRGPMSARREAWFAFLTKGIDDIDMVFFALQADPSLYITPELIR